MSTSIAASARLPLLVAKMADWLTMPMPMPATTATGSLSIRAITAADEAVEQHGRADGRADGEADQRGPQEHGRRPRAGRRCTHTMVETRATGMPSSEARSPFSAEARTAMPMSVKRKKAASAAQITAVANPAMRKLPSKTSDAERPLVLRPRGDERARR